MSKRGVDEANLSSKNDESKLPKVDDRDEKHDVEKDSSLSQQCLYNELRSTLKGDISAVSQKLGEIFVTQSEANEALQFHGGFIEMVSTRLLKLEQREREREKQITDLKNELLSTKEELSSVKTEVKENTKEIKGNNMIINGLKEPANENCKDTAVDFLRKLVPELDANHLSNVYRMGRTSGSGEVNRALFIKFRDGDMKARVMKQKSQLHRNKNLGLKSVFCNDDLSEDMRLSRQEMREIARFAKGTGYNDAVVKGDKLYIQGKTYTDEELHLLPKNLKLENIIRTRKVGKGVGFISKHSYLSNFYPVPVTINGRNFISSEQAYQFSKAMACEREDIAISVMARTDPKKMKKDGDRVDITPDWENNKDEVMKCILTGKFSQNPELLKKLKETGDAPLYECSTNKYWGTGWRLEAPGWLGSAPFPGRNTLGNLLMEVRGILCTGLDHAPLNEGLKKSSKKQNTTLREIREGEEDLIIDPRKKPPNDENLLSEAAGGIPKGTNEISINCSDIMDVDSSSSLSGDSEVFDRSNFNAKSVMLEDGHLNRDKLLSWALPTLDTSRLRKLAAQSFPSVLNKGEKGSRSAVVMPTQSTPVTHVTRRKSKKGINGTFFKCLTTSRRNDHKNSMD